MTRELARLLDDGIAARCWRVVAEDLQRMALDGVEPAFAGSDGSVMLIGLADLELEVAAGEIGIEALDALDDLPLRQRLFRGHLGLGNFLGALRHVLVPSYELFRRERPTRPLLERRHHLPHPPARRPVLAACHRSH